MYKGSRPIDGSLLVITKPNQIRAETAKDLLWEQGHSSITVRFPLFDFINTNILLKETRVHYSQNMYCRIINGSIVRA